MNMPERPYTPLRYESKVVFTTDGKIRKTIWRNK